MTALSELLGIALPLDPLTVAARTRGPLDDLAETMFPIKVGADTVLDRCRDAPIVVTLPRGRVQALAISCMATLVVRGRASPPMEVYLPEIPLDPDLHATLAALREWYVEETAYLRKLLDKNLRRIHRAKPDDAVGFHPCDVWPVYIPPRGER